MFIVLGIILGVFIALFFVGRLTVSLWLPALAKLLENDPNDPKKFAATTKVGPNRGKFKMRGGEIVSLLMNIDGHKQKGGPTAPDKFEIVPLAKDEVLPPEEMGSIDAFSYRHSGYRFYNPFSEHIYTYPFPRTDEVMGLDALLKPVGITDVSDYFLLSEQTYSFTIDDAETGLRENVKVTFKGKITFLIVNPHKAGFKERKWLLQSIAAVRVRARNFSRARDFETLLGEVGRESDELKDIVGRDLVKVSNSIEDGPGTEERFGVRVTLVLVETIDMTDTEADKSRVAKYNAARAAEVVGIAAKAEAGRIKTIRTATAEAEAIAMLKVTRATRAAGAVGLKLLDQQTQIGIAKEAGTVIMQVGGGTTIDPINAQILEELKRKAPTSDPKHTAPVSRKRGG